MVYLEGIRYLGRVLFGPITLRMIHFEESNVCWFWPLGEFGEVFEGELELEATEGVEDDGGVFVAVHHGDFAFQAFEGFEPGELAVHDLDAVVDFGRDFAVFDGSAGQVEDFGELADFPVGDAGEVGEVVLGAGEGGVFEVAGQVGAGFQDGDAVLLGHADEDFAPYDDFLPQGVGLAFLFGLLAEQHLCGHVGFDVEGDCGGVVQQLAGLDFGAPFHFCHVPGCRVKHYLDNVLFFLLMKNPIGA